jgi:hypothetical protein
MLAGGGRRRDRVVAPHVWNSALLHGERSAAACYGAWTDRTTPRTSTPGPTSMPTGA